MHMLSPEENIRSEIAQIVSIPSGDRTTEDKSRLNALEAEIQRLLSVGTMPLPIFCTRCNREGVTGTQCTDDCSYVGGHNFVLFPTTLPHAGKKVSVPLMYELRKSELTLRWSMTYEKWKIWKENFTVTKTVL